MTKFTGCAISLAPRVDFSDGAAWRPAPVEGADAKAEAAATKVALCDHIFGQVRRQKRRIRTPTLTTDPDPDPDH